ncbi:hypothetical protein [Roseomonas indoligenes]|uniref:Uncharacterized protein n=1 Tax=Roseomonas indoligenes TaxID=2820811 RepID=A0A940MZD5_9PROT|nr:hypothetical protein [Pararoseomonas indoligenes]MBP0494976.1 hypothetical protein [Pararoseomonas indoligenes]
MMNRTVSSNGVGQEVRRSRMWGLDTLLDELVTRFNAKDLPRSLLFEVGLVLIQQLALPNEVAGCLAKWQERWTETVRLEALPMRRQA